VSNSKRLSGIFGRYGVITIRPAGGQPPAGLSATRGTECDITEHSVSPLHGKVVFLVDLACFYGGSVCYKYGLSMG
jgi:hypothetical protein